MVYFGTETLDTEAKPKCGNEREGEVKLNGESKNKRKGKSEVECKNRGRKW